MNFVWLKRKKIQNPCISKIRVSKEKMSKNVHLKFFWTQFKIVHCRGPCSLRPCISRPYCSRKIEVLKVAVFNIYHEKFMNFSCDSKTQIKTKYIHKNSSVKKSKTQILY